MSGFKEIKLSFQFFLSAIHNLVQFRFGKKEKNIKHIHNHKWTYCNRQQNQLARICVSQ